MLTVKTLIPKLVLKVSVTLREILFEELSSDVDTEEKFLKRDCKNVHRKNSYEVKMTYIILLLYMRIQRFYT